MFGSRALVQELRDRNDFLTRTNRQLRSELADAREQLVGAEARVHRFANDRVKVSRQDATEMAHLGDEIKKLTAQRDEAIALNHLQAMQITKLQAANEKHYQDLAAEKEAS